MDTTKKVKSAQRSYDGTMMGDRFKRAEKVFESHLIRRMPVIIRVDGNCFHTFTKRFFGKKYSGDFVNLMKDTAMRVCQKIQGCKLAYLQGDEVSFLLTDYETLETDCWFSYDVNKLVSISASMFAAYFNTFMFEYIVGKCPTDRKYGYLDENKNFHAWFDSRAFNLTKEEVCNYFVWRQIDWLRNTTCMWSREYFSHKELNHVTCKQMQEMMFQKTGINFDKLPVQQKRGICIYKEYTKDLDIEWKVDREPPQFTKDRNYIEKYIYLDENDKK